MNIFQKVTLKNLKENRTRTLVTIIGIILSAAMFTAVTVSISSLRHYLVSYTVYKQGSWYGAAYDLTLEEANTISTDNEVSTSIRMNRIGYAALSDCQNESKPYLCVYGITKDFTELMPVHLTEGRMPQNSSEILLPEHLSSNGGITYELNDTLSLELGTRVDANGYVLNNQTGYDLDGTGEQIIDTQPYTYTVVGFYERPSFEDYSAPGYTALTISDASVSGLCDIYFCTKNGADISNYMDAHMNTFEKGTSWTMNYSLLRLYGYSGESTYNSVLTNLGIILVIIIAFGSISLIYNAFSISVSERTRQFGLLSSIGATKHQLTGSVLFEAFFLSIIGIPLGMLSGMIGIGITFYFTGDMIANFLYSDSEVTLALHASIPALLIAVLVSLITILISAYLPARRAMKGSAIEAIRQSKDIAIRPGKVKTAKLTLRLFGFEGMLAAKNYKRNGKKYRATVISLFLSIVLFISASSFCAYLTKSTNSILTNQGYDISYALSPEEDYSPDTLLEELSSVAGVTSGSYSSSFWLNGSVSSSSLSKEYVDFQKQIQEQENTGSAYIQSENILTNFYINFIKDDVFRKYLSENGLPESDYFDSEHPTAVMLDNMRFYNGYDQKYHTFSMLSSFENCNPVLYLTREIEGYMDYGCYTDENGNILFTYAPESSENNTEMDEKSEKLELAPKECCLILPLKIGASLPVSPDNTPSSSEVLTLYYPYSMIDAVFSNLEDGMNYSNLPREENQPVSEHLRTTFMFCCKDHTTATADMTKLLSDRNLPTEPLYDYAASADQERAMITVINIFSYGFIILISLIAAANVFNTISTNINLRKREFAMLKSIGLTPDGFQKMMNFECLLYGFKGLIYGLPVSILITWFIYHAISNGLEMNFFIPWYSIVIAVGSVFLVVFATMLYSMKKIKKENIMDILKDENI